MIRVMALPLLIEQITIERPTTGGIVEHLKDLVTIKNRRSQGLLSAERNQQFAWRNWALLFNEQKKVG